MKTPEKLAAAKRVRALIAKYETFIGNLEFNRDQNKSDLQLVDRLNRAISIYRDVISDLKLL